MYANEIDNLDSNKNYEATRMLYSLSSSDELALDSLQTSWKPFMETGDNKEIRLVLGISG